MMTISSANSLLLSAEIPLDAQLSGSLNLMNSESDLLDESLLTDDFWALLNDQMTQSDEMDAEDTFNFSNNLDDSSEESVQNPLASLFELFESVPGEQAGEAANDISPAVEIALEPGQNRDDLLDETPQFIMPSLTSETRQTVALSSAGSDDRILRPGENGDRSGEQAELSSRVANLNGLTEKAGDLLPPTRQMAATQVSAIDSGEMARTVSDAANSTLNPVLKGKDPVVSGQSGDGEFLESEDTFQVSEQEKEPVESLRKEAQKFEAYLAKHETATPQNIPARESAGLSPASEFGAVAMMQAHNAAPSSTSINAVTHTLQLAPQATSAQWGEALGEKVTLLISNKLQSAEIRIDPPHLGKLDIQIQLKDDTATINIQTHHAPTRDLIDAASFRLREFLQDSGYSSVDVNVSHREQSMARQDSGENQQQAAPAHNEFQGTTRVSEGLHEPLALQMSSGNALIDFFA